MGTVKRTPAAALSALLGVLVLATSSGAAGRAGVGRMSVTPNRVNAGSTGIELVFTFVADSAAVSGVTIVDVSRGWTLPQRTNPNGNGYVELQPTGCTSATRITGIVGRRITIATTCARKHFFKLLYHRASAPLLAADGYIFLTQTRPTAPKTGARRKVLFKPLGPRKQPVVRVRGSAASNLFMTLTSVATVGTPFSATVRAIDQWGNNAADYTGTVTLTSTDPLATLPGPYIYGPTDTAQHVFTGVILRTTGTQRITATDSAGRSISSGPITVSPGS
jgi:hypothetical protein